jgi:uncharacterized membrane protein YphA (DoxX/SURF4 family)
MKRVWSAGTHPAAGSAKGGRWIFNPYVLLAFRLFLAAIFIYAAVQKIGKPHAFADEIRNYGVVDYGPPLYIMAVVLPWVELFCGLALVTGVALRGAALFLIGLNVMFLVVISKRTAEYVSGGTSFMEVYFDCGCGFGAVYAWKKLLEDGLYLLFALALLVAPRHRFTVSIGRRSS